MIEFVYLAIIELWLVGLLGLNRAAANTKRVADGAPPATLPVFIVAGTLAAAFIAQLRIIELASASQVPFPARYARLPLTPIDDSVPHFGHTPYWVNSSVLVLTILECIALTLLYRIVRGRRLAFGGIAVVVSASAAMIGASLATRAITTTDLYFYVGLAHLGTAAYAPPNVPLMGEFSPINQIWGVPMLPSPYGPLWLGLSQLVIRASDHLGGESQAFRIVGLVGFVACIALLVKLKVAPAVVALFSLNPALIEQYVANGHNDIIAVAFSLAALCVVSRRPLLAAILGAAAGAVKLPFALVSILAFARSDKTPAARLTWGLLTCVLSVAFTLSATGGRYIAAAYVVTNEYRSARGLTIHSVAILLAIATILMAILWKRFIPTGSWSMLAFTHAIFPWYVVLALPYAVLEEALLPLYLVTLPLVAFCFTTVYGMTIARHLVYVFLITLVPVLLVPVLRGIRKTGVSQPDYAGT